MSNRTICVAIYMTHAQADEAFSRLQVAGLGMSSLSIMGRDYWNTMVGSRNTGEKFTFRGKHGPFWERLWANLSGWGIFWFFADGPVLVAGRLVRAIIATQEQGNTEDGASVFEAGLTGIGIPKDSLVQYEQALMNDQILIFIHGTPNEINHAQDILNETKAINHTVHHGAGDFEEVPA